MPTTQSSNGTANNAKLVSAFAVDGNLLRYSHTGARAELAWWKVDMKTVVEINHIDLWLSVLEEKSFKGYQDVTFETRETVSSPWLTCNHISKIHTTPRTRNLTSGCGGGCKNDVFTYRVTCLPANTKATYLQIQCPGSLMLYEVRVMGLAMFGKSELLYLTQMR